MKNTDYNVLNTLKLKDSYNGSALAQSVSVNTTFFKKTAFQSELLILSLKIKTSLHSSHKLE